MRERKSEYQSLCPFVGIGSLQPLPRKRVWLPPPLGPKWGEWDTPACVGVGGGTQFRRRDRNSGTLCIQYYNPCTGTRQVIIAYIANLWRVTIDSSAHPHVNSYIPTPHSPTPPQPPGSISWHKAHTRLLLIFRVSLGVFFVTNASFHPHRVSCSCNQLFRNTVMWTTIWICILTHKEHFFYLYRRRELRWNS